MHSQKMAKVQIKQQVVKLIRVSLLVGLTVGTGVACTGSASFMATRFEALYDPPSDAVLMLHQDLVIPANVLAVYLQNGRATPGGVNHYEPSCKFELRYKKPYTQTVRAGVFKIRQFTRHRGNFAGASATLHIPVRHRRRLDLFGADAPSFIVYSSYFFLESAAQPDVLRLTCSHWQFWGEGRFLSLADIQTALGDVMSIRSGV